MTRQTAEYWQDINNIKIELSKFIDKDGLLSNYRQINTEYPALTRAISTYHGGIQKIREILGLDKKRCSKCGEVKDLSQFRTVRNPNGRTMLRGGQCKQCGYSDVVKYRDTDLGIAANICRFTKARAKKHGWAYDLNREWVSAQLNEIGWKCQVTGIPFERIGKNFFESWTSVSIDRIDSSKGYTRDNVQFVIAWVNKAKAQLPMDKFIDFCKVVATRN